MTIDRFTAPEALPSYFSVEEMGRFLSIGRTLAYALVRQGVIPSVKLGRTVRIPRGKLLAKLQCLEVQKVVDGDKVVFSISHSLV